MAKENLTKSADVQVAAREIDFVTRFQRNWDGLLEIMGVMRPIKKDPGVILKSKKAHVVLQGGNVGEGEVIPYSKATVEEIPYDEMDIEKYAKAVSLEAIKEKGYDVAVGMTDNAFLVELQSDVMKRFYNYLLTGTNVDAYDTFQMALSMASAKVRERFREMKLDCTQIVGFANIMDVGKYLGEANITLQQNYGMTYIENFLGYRVLFLCSDDEIPRGRIAATPVENIVLYYVDPGDSDFAKAGLVYRTEGVTPLIGFHAQGNYGTAVTENFAIMGLTLFAEYIDGIAVVAINSKAFTAPTTAAEAQATDFWGTPVSSLQENNIVVANGMITGTLKYLATGALATDWGPGNFIGLKWTNVPEGAKVRVGLVPSVSSGLVELDADRNAAIKITNKDVQKLAVETTLGKETIVNYFDLSALKCLTE